MSAPAKPPRRPGKTASRYAREAPSEWQAAWRSLSVKRRLAVATELVLSRQSELLLAYPDTKSLAYGFRTSGESMGPATKGTLRKRAQRRSVDQNEVCVTFLVSRKRPRCLLSASGKRRVIPSFLPAFCTLNRKRFPCAVPTNVECSSNYRVFPHIYRCHTLSEDGFHTDVLERGVITCVVNLPDKDGLYALSCHHVMALSTIGRRYHPFLHIKSARTYVRRGEALRGPEICRLTPLMGRLVPEGHGFSFDAALAKITITGMTALSAVMSSGPTKFHRSNDKPHAAKIVTPGGPVDATFVQVWPGFKDIAYFASGPQPVHVRVAELQVTSPRVPQPGDSGSPVVMWDAPDTLLGMHIGGDEAKRKAFMLLAVDLLDGRNYNGLSGNLTLADTGL